MLTGAAMAAVPARAVAPFATRDATGLGARSSGVGAGRAALARPAAARRPVRAAPAPTRAGEALDWENDDFVPASKANKKKKAKGGNTAQAAKQKSKAPKAPAEALDWESDDFVPAGKAKKNKKKPKAKGAAQEAPEPPAAGGVALDWENDDFVPAGKAKKNKKKPKKGGDTVAEAPTAEAPPAIADPVVDVDEDAAAADAARVAADAAAAAAEAAAAAADAAAAAAAAQAAAAQAKAKAAADAADAAAAAAAPPEVPEEAPEVVAEEVVDEDEEIEEMDEKALEKATRAAIREAEEKERREEEERLAAIDWNAPDEDDVDDGNIIPRDLRDIFAKDARPSKRRTSGTVTTGVRLENVKKAFKGAEVLKGCSWDCKRGERVGLVGWNGAGKTTQLRIITGEMEADEGEVMLADKVKIGYLTQEFEVKETNTVREEFMASFGEESQVIRDTERIQKALENEPNMELMTVLLEKLDELQKKAERLDLFNMERAIDKIMPTLGFVPEDNDRLVASFSGGWQMRISLGKILLQEPWVVVNGRAHESPRSGRDPVVRGVPHLRGRPDGDCVARPRVPGPALHENRRGGARPRHDVQGQLQRLPAREALAGRDPDGGVREVHEGGDEAEGHDPPALRRRSVRSRQRGGEGAGAPGERPRGETLGREGASVPFPGRASVLRDRGASRERDARLRREDAVQEH
jgi:ABC-type Mn2+/Zn2+ transport system ATPase subunit